MSQDAGRAVTSLPDAIAPDAPKECVFFRSQVREPHYGRTRDIMARHPEIAGLVGRNPWTFAIIATVCSAQIGTAWFLTTLPWWASILTAYLFGAFLTHALWAMIHECVHRRVLKGDTANRFAGILANLTMVVPTATSFEKYHLKHHIYQGVYDHDADLPCRWELKLFAGTVAGRMIWLLIFPILYTLRPSRMRETQLWDSWLVLNLAIVAAFDVAVLYFWGPVALLYLALSMLFALGLHPLGGRWIQEHFTSDPEQETFSYYGPLNAVQLNIGYHNEHHDFPGVPWNRLPELKRIASDDYTSLKSHSSWTRLLLNFAISGDPDVNGRVVRASRKPKRTAEAT